MAQKSKPRSSLKASYRGFEGVNFAKTHSGDESVALIDNFRICSDGSLKKRSGFKTLLIPTEESSDITALHHTHSFGKELCFFTSCENAFCYDYQTDTLTVIGALSKNSTQALFFEYCGRLYLCDGAELFAVSESALSPPDVYIPLYGKNWLASYAGDICEPINLLSRKVAISYKFASPSQGYLSIGDLKIKAISALYRNGELMSEDFYYFDEEYNIVTLTDHEDDDEYFVIYDIEFDEENELKRKQLFGSIASSVFYELNNKNLFLWGNRACNDIFYTTPVDKSNAEITESFIPDNGSLYIPFNSCFSVGESQERVNAFIRHYDRVLIMTNTSTLITDLSLLGTPEFSIRNINASIGCSSPRGALRFENHLISVGHRAIYSWTSDTDELNECNAYSISEEIKPLLADNFFDNCVMTVYEKERELWVSSISANELWIYNLNRKAWYKFSGFIPHIFAESSSEVCFADGKSVYLFSPELHSDLTPSGEQEIKATFKSGELEFNSRRKKKLSSIFIRGESSGGSLLVSFTLDGSRRLTRSLITKNSHGIFNLRARSGRFDSLSFELVSLGNGEQTVHEIELDAD